MAWRAGATTGLNCILCQAGSYQTGSGETVLWARNHAFPNKHHLQFSFSFFIFQSFSIFLYFCPFDFLIFVEGKKIWPRRHGVQARRQASTAACARRGPTRLDPVRLRYEPENIHSAICFLSQSLYLFPNSLFLMLLSFCLFRWLYPDCLKIFLKNIIL